MASTKQPLMPPPTSPDPGISKFLRDVYSKIRELENRVKELENP